MDINDKLKVFSISVSTESKNWKTDNFFIYFQKCLLGIRLKDIGKCHFFIGSTKKELKGALFLYNLSPHRKWFSISIKATDILVQLENKQENVITASLFSHPYINWSQRLWICKDAMNAWWSNFSKMLHLNANRLQNLFQADFQRNRFPFSQIKTFTVLERENKHLFRMCWHHYKYEHMV